MNTEEMYKLITILEEKGIEFEVEAAENGMQVEGETWQVFCTPWSYGHKEGLLEVFGLPLNCDHPTIGFTAEQVLQMLEYKKQWYNW